jgi:hypothetical protein
MFEAGSCWVAQAGLKLTTLLPQLNLIHNNDLEREAVEASQMGTSAGIPAFPIRM